MDYDVESKKCHKCMIKQPVSCFRNGKYNTCKKCDNERDKLLKKQARAKRLDTFVVCELCNNTKQLREFAKLKKYYKRHICLDCYPIFLRTQKAEWCKNESVSNPSYRIKKSLAARLRQVLVKNESTMNYIGCNIQYLREWFEYNFTEEMNWNNYGTYWSIDHVIPVRYFDLTNEDEKYLCWNWSNMIPVTVEFNSKKKTIDMEQINHSIEQLNKFKEEGSTTKWFSEKFILTRETAIMKNEMKI
jgi:hypothetical protein